MGDRKKNVIILISAVIVICIAGIAYYGFKFTKQTPKKADISKDVKQEKRLKGDEVSSDKIKTLSFGSDVNDEKDIISISDDKVVYRKNNVELKIADRKTKKADVIEGFNLNTEYNNACSNESYVVLIEEVNDSNSGENNPNKSLMKIFNVKSGKSSILDSKEALGSEDTSNNKRSEFGPCIKIKDNKIIYTLFTNNGVYIMNYDIDNNKVGLIYSIPYTDRDLIGLYSFDIDLKNGYMIIGSKISDKKNGTVNLLTLLDIKNKKKTLLAKSSQEISTSIYYPNVAFQIKDKIHMYNIEKKKDDFVLQCGKNPCNVEIKDDYVIWNDDKLSIYSIKDKKLYETANGWFKDDPNYNGEKMTSGDIVFWKDNDNIKYINLKDIEG